MLHFIIGTKAQFIKMAPVMQAAERRSLPWRLVDLGQHAALTGRILEDFGLQPEIMRLSADRTSVADYWHAMRWAASLLGRGVSGSRTRAQVFGGKGGAALVHGDTLSTLIGTLLARRAGLEVALVEAGLTSGSWLTPFPEELIRRSCERMAHLLLAPGPDAARRLAARFPDKRVVDTGYNTGRDALLGMLPAQPPAARHVLATLHRLETLSSRRKLSRAVEFIRAAARLEGPVVFVLHPPTRSALLRYGLLDSLEDAAGLRLEELLPYPEFVVLLAGARAVLTDGGSVQEECSYLKRPCIILRDRTERPHGLNDTAIITSWSVSEDFDRLCPAVPISELERGGSGHAASDRVIDAVES